MSDGKRFLYGLRSRPADLNAVPVGFTLLAGVDKENPNMRYGAVSYDRALTQGEVASFELVPLVDDTGRILQAPLVPKAVLSIVEQALEFLAYVDAECGADPLLFPDDVKEAVQEQVEKIAIFERWANNRVDAHQLITELGGLPERFYSCDETGLHFKDVFKAGLKPSQRCLGG